MVFSREGGLEERRAAEVFAVQQFLTAKDKDPRSRDEAWTKLQRVFEPDLRSHLQSKNRGADQSKIDDLVQETFLSAFRSFDAFDATHPEGFVFLLRNLADRRTVDASRKIHGRKGTSTYHPENRERSLEPADEEGHAYERLRPQSEASQETALIEAEEREQLMAALGSLKERERQVMIMRHVLGMDLKDIGAVLGVTESRICQIAKPLEQTLAERIRRQPSTTPMSPEQFQALVADVRAKAAAVLGEDALEEMAAK